MDNIQIFENPVFGTVRVFELGGSSWFAGKDVADILGYANPSKALNDHVDEDDKLHNETLSSLGQRGGWLINESGVYSLILSSKMPKAKAFKRWVTAEVLPSIRRHGMYAVDEILDNPDLGIRILQELKAEREHRKALEGTVAIQHQQITEMQPKVSYYDLILQCSDLMPVTTIAKDYGWSAKRFNAYLHAQGIQFKQSGIWLLYQQYAEQGYTSTKTHNYADSEGHQHAKVHTYWTQKGRLFLYDFLKGYGVLPRIEQGSAE